MESREGRDVRIPTPERIEEYEKNFSPFTDKLDVELRSEILGHILEFTEDTTKGAFSLDVIKKAKRALDIGMGKGSLGVAMKAINPDLEIVGIDRDEHQDRKGLEAYKQRIIGSALNPDVWRKFQEDGVQFDFITSVGLPPEVLDLLLSSKNITSALSPEGTAILFTDAPVTSPDTKTWQQYQGSFVADNNIFIHKNNLENTQS